MLLLSRFSLLFACSRALFVAVLRVVRVRACVCVWCRGYPRSVVHVYCWCRGPPRCLCACNGCRDFNRCAITIIIAPLHFYLLKLFQWRNLRAPAGDLLSQWRNLRAPAGDLLSQCRTFSQRSTGLMWSPCCSPTSSQESSILNGNSSSTKSLRMACSAPFRPIVGASSSTSVASRTDTSS